MNWKSSILLLLLLLCSYSLVNAQAGKDGNFTPASSGSVNAYTILLADVNAGAVNISVADIALTTNFSSPLAGGDLLFIVQVQGAYINTSDDATYGNILSYLNCGNNEFAQVASIPAANTIRLTCPLKNSYSVQGRVQVIRVPRYASLTINSGITLSPPIWNGSFGGIIVIEVQGATVINSGGSISADGLGFRPGLLNENLTAYGVLNYVWNAGDYGGEKGEGIAGPTTDYDMMGGRYAKGAPANGGGGANAHNGGGGGGGNASRLAWTGTGVPDLSNGYSSAWNLESPGLASTTSGGGGKGGYTFSSSNQNALTTGPFNSAWGGDQRRENGGRGGRPLDYSTGKIFMGGGGGSGDQNNSFGGIGGRGGGIVYLKCYSTVSGSGSINANGTSGTSTTGTDGAGGGGAGGTIMIEAANVAGISLNANGGNGGNQVVGPFVNEAEGPGGGGGGGYIGITNGGPARTANGGSNGTTNSYGLTEFPPNGATGGGPGIFDGFISSFNFTANPVTACYNSPVTLTAVTTGTVPAGTTFQWYNAAVGGVLLGTGLNYTTPALTITTTFYLGTCPGVYRVPVTVTVDRVTGSFTYLSNCVGNPLSFTSTASSTLGTVSSYQWNFGDGGSSAIQNPSHTFALAGTYTVTLVITDSYNCQTIVTQNVTVGSGPIINFTSNATSPCNSPTVVFSNTTSGATSFSWNFGDGGTSTQTSPTHTYAAPGAYIVTLVATGGSCSSTRRDTIRIGTPPTASFGVNATTICLGDTIRFTNQSSANGGTIAGYIWNFGNSTTSSLANPVIVYPSAGTYNVQLTVSNGCLDDTIRTIRVNPKPTAAFSSSATTGCAPLAINFTNNSSSAASYSWTFGDGGTAISTSPSHTYSQAGNYSVVLTAINGSCTSTSSATINLSNKPFASFAVSSASICLSDTIRFTNFSTGNGSPITSYQWDLGNGSTSNLQTPSYRYTLPGSYNIRLTVVNGSCNDDTTISVTVNPGPVSSFASDINSGCLPLSVNFSNASTGSASYQWSFGDGATSTSATPSHTYSTAGNYTVTLISVSGSCSDTLRRTNFISVGTAPVSSFSTTDVCYGDTSQFNNLSGGVGTNTFTWNFGDGVTASSYSPSHAYTLPGQYTATLIVNSGGCQDDTSITVTVHANPVAAFTVNNTTGCDTVTVSFINNSNGAISYLWNFGDNTTSVAAQPTHFYSSPGNYSVSLTATNQYGCSGTRVLANAVRLLTGPTAAFSSSSTNVCTNGCVTLNDQSSASATSWNWSVPGGNPNASTATNPVICFPIVGNYSVTLTVSNGQCSSSISRSGFISVTDCSTLPVAGFLSSDTVLCNGACISYSNLTVNGTVYQWTFTGATPSSSTDQNPQNICYNSPGSFPVKLISTNAAGSDTMEVMNFIQVQNGPGVPVITQNADTLISTPAFSYQWLFRGIPISGATQQTYLAMISGTYTVQITDLNGCTAISQPYDISLTGFNSPESTALVVYPNPAKDKVFLLTNGISNIIYYSIRDVLGRELKSGSFYPATNIELNLSPDISPGTYFFQFTYGDTTIYRKIVIE